MTLVNPAGDVLLNAEKVEFHGVLGFCMAAFHSSAQAIANGMGFAVGRSPVENPIIVILRARNARQSKDKQPDQHGKTLHT